LDQPYGRTLRTGGLASFVIATANFRIESEMSALVDSNIPEHTLFVQAYQHGAALRPCRAQAKRKRYHKKS
jgi:hypothetical protein